MSCGYTDSTVSTSVISGLLFHDSVSTTIMKAVSELEVMHGMRFAYIHETDRKFTFLKNMPPLPRVPHSNFLGTINKHSPPPPPPPFLPDT